MTNSLASTPTIRTHRHRNRLALALAFLALAFLTFAAGCKKKADPAPEVAVAVQADHPTVGPIAEQIVADAILAPIAAAALSPRLSAPIRAEYVQRGAHVRRGQLLVSLDDRDLKGSVLDSSGAVTSAQANYTATNQTTIPEEARKAELDLAQLKAALEIATRTARERQTLYKQGALSGREADAATAAELQAQAAYDAVRQHATLLQQTTRLTDKQAAQGQLTSAKGRLPGRRKPRSATPSLRSPIDGVVTDRAVLRRGDRRLLAPPSSPSWTPRPSSPNSTSPRPPPRSSSLGGTRPGSPCPGIDDPVPATVSFLSPAARPWLHHHRGLAQAAATPMASSRPGTPVHVVHRPATTVPNAHPQLPKHRHSSPQQDGSGSTSWSSRLRQASHQKAAPSRVGIRNAR